MLDRLKSLFMSNNNNDNLNCNNNRSCKIGRRNHCSLLCWCVVMVGNNSHTITTLMVSLLVGSERLMERERLMINGKPSDVERAEFRVGASCA